jgi:hypothetical protein
MKVTVEISDKELQEVIHFTGERKKGPAIRKLVADALMLCRRRAATSRIMSGDWQFEMPSWHAARVRERRASWPR